MKNIVTYINSSENNQHKVIKESSYINDSVELSLELYRDGNTFGICINDNSGGSGIEATGETPDEAANNIASYIADYFYK